MADGPLGKRDINIDLTVVGARTIRDPATGQWVKIQSITISGTTGAGAGNIVLREETASTGNVIFRFETTNATQYNVTPEFAKMPPVFKGLFMDALGTAWAAGSTMVIHTT